MLSNKSIKGFTLIELLVVISIIGLISSVVLSALGTARAKGNNSAIKSQLAGMRAAAEAIYDANPSTQYLGVCGTDSFRSMVTVAHNNSSAGAAPTWVSSQPQVSAAVPPVIASVCHSSTSSWAVSIPLKVAEGTIVYWCTDATGYSIGRVSPLNANATVCPAT